MHDLYIKYLVIIKTVGVVDFEHVAPYPVSYPSLIVKMTISVCGDSCLSFFRYMMRMVTENTSLKKHSVKLEIIKTPLMSIVCMPDKNGVLTMTY